MVHYFQFIDYPCKQHYSSEKMCFGSEPERKIEDIELILAILGLHRDCQVFSTVIAGQEGFDRSARCNAKPRLWPGPGMSGLVILLFSFSSPCRSRLPELQPDARTVPVPAVVLHSSINILIAVLFHLLGEALYFQKEPRPRR